MATGGVLETMDAALKHKAGLETTAAQMLRAADSIGGLVQQISAAAGLPIPSEAAGFRWPPDPENLHRSPEMPASSFKFFKGATGEGVALTPRKRGGQRKERTPEYMQMVADKKRYWACLYTRKTTGLKPITFEEFQRRRAAGIVTSADTGRKLVAPTATATPAESPGKKATRRKR